MSRSDECAVYGDKAYASPGVRDRLADAGINDGLMYKAARNKPLKPWQSWFNSAPVVHRHQSQACGGDRMTPRVCTEQVDTE